MIPILLTFILNDLVFEKYHYEEEDFMQNINEESIHSFTQPSAPTLN